MVAAFGIRLTDRLEFEIIATAPFEMRLPADRQFLYGSPFTFFIGSYYLHHGLSRDLAYAVVSITGVTLFAFAIVRVFGRGRDERTRNLAILLLACTPLPFVILSWIGKSDPFLLGFFLLLTQTESAATGLLLSALIPACHRELGAALLLVYVFLRPSSWKIVLPGLIVGEAAMAAYTQLLLSPAPASRLDYAIANAERLWRIFQATPMLHVLLAFGPFWIFVFTRRRELWRAAAVIAPAFILAIASQDFTRVFVIVTAPLLIEFIKQIADEIGTNGGLALGRYRLGAHAFWPLMFIQAQIAGNNLLWAHGIDIRLVP